ncbi:MAG: hypothetical protein E6K31_08615 [Gammaproteobacteria bacterium]|nr:MAG: hypothetical protein E6K31_08615 [Gammaproteobacteria bacterium]
MLSSRSPRPGSEDRRGARAAAGAIPVERLNAVIDPKLLRSDPDAVARNLARRGYRLDVAAFRALEEKRKPCAVEVDRLRAERNANARAVGAAKGRGEDAAALITRGEQLTASLSSAEAALLAVYGELEQWQLGLPNLLDPSVPDGQDESANREVRRWGEPRSFSFAPRDHVELGERLRGLDFEAAARLSSTAARSPAPASCRISSRISSRCAASTGCISFRPPRCRSPIWSASRSCPRKRCR